ncbi:MAG: 16S rRNA (cytosine(1402)-N(4))-methyltransferase RsmH [Fidelibacterota bacterium]
MTTIHEPVLLKEAMQLLVSKPDGIYLDATLGTGGHFKELSNHLNEYAFLIGIDADSAAIYYCSENLQIPQNHLFLHSNFNQIRKICFRQGNIKVDGMIMDLGLSSFGLANPQRGFSYATDGPLDMRFSQDQQQTAADIVNQAELSELIRIFQEYGEEHHSRAIARLIIKARSKSPIKTTSQLAALVKQKAVEPHVNKTLSRIFQALRIAVNRELEVLKQTLKDSIEILNPGGRLVIITYHSLEDRLVKNFFKTESRDCICPPEFPVCQCHHQAVFNILTPKPLRPSKTEISQNARARSAQLRAVERLH